MGSPRLRDASGSPPPPSPGKKPLRGWLAHLLLATLPVTGLLGLAEIGARAEFRWRKGYPYSAALAFSPHPDLVYQRNPDHWPWQPRPAEMFRGFFLPPLEDDRPRLWILGGSTSEAKPDGIDWPSQLQAMLPDWRVVNMSLSGYGTSQIRRLYQEGADTVNPGAVVIFSGWNYRGAVTSQFGWRPANTSSRFDGLAHRASATLINGSAAYGRASGLWERLLPRGQGCASPPTLPESEFDAWVFEYRRLIRFVQRENTVYLVLFPGAAMRSDGNGAPVGGTTCVAEHFATLASEYARRIAAMERLSAETGVPVLDARPAYRGLPREQFSSYFGDPSHQTAAGNAYLAQVLLAELRARGLRTD